MTANRSSKLLSAAIPVAASLLAIGATARADFIFVGTNGTSWYDAGNWVESSTSPDTLNSLPDQTRTVLINTGVAGTGVVFDPATQIADPNALYTIGDASPRFYVSANNAGAGSSDTDWAGIPTQPNYVDVRSGTLRVANSFAIIGRSAPATLIMSGGTFTVDQRLDLGNTNAGFTGSGTLIYQSGNVEFGFNNGGSSSPGLRAGGATGTTAKVTLYNDGAGHIHVMNYLPGYRNDSGSVLAFNETHFDNGNVKTMQIDGQLSIRNSATPSTGSARLGIVLDEAPSVDGLGAPQNLALYDTDFNDDNGVNDRVVTNAAGPARFFNWDGSAAYVSAADLLNPGGRLNGYVGASATTLTAVYGTKYYNWKINYGGNITWTGDTVTGIQGEDEAAMGETTWNDVVLIGESSTQGSQWIHQGNENWGDGGNWDGGVPNAVGQIANFLSVPTVPVNVNVDAGMVAGYMNFDNSQSYTVSGSSITLDAPVNWAAINVFSGNHTVSAPISLNDDLMLEVVPSGSTLSLTGAVTATGKTIKKTGAGTAQLENVRATALDVRAGTVKISAKGSANQTGGTSVVNSLRIDTGAQVDLTNNSMVIDYAGAAGTMENDVRQHLQSGRMTSSSAAGGTKLGYGDNAVLNKGSFGGVTVDTDSMLIKFTYAGDANLDGQVTISDLGDLASNWQSTAAVWRNGDFNYDGQVTISDLGDLASNWQAGVGSPLGMSFQEALAAVGFDGSAVPEPATMSLLGLLGACTLKRSRRR